MVRARVDGGRIVKVACHPVRPNGERQTVIRAIEDEGEVMCTFQEHSRRFDAAADFGDGVLLG